MPHFASIYRAFALALLGAAPLAAQAAEPPRAGTISGSVRDARSSAPIPDASVTLDGATLTALPAPPRSSLLRQTRATRTDTLGAYIFGGVTAGEYRLHVQRDGYQSTTVVVALRSAAVLMEPLSLRPRRVTHAEERRRTLPRPATDAEERRRNLPRTIGVGYGSLSSGTVVGPAWHAQASASFARAPGPGSARAEVWVMAEHGTGSGSGMACEEVRPIHCFGRTNHTTLVGAGIASVLEGSILGAKTYGRAGAGLYHQRVRSREFEGPTALCFGETEEYSCPDNPPFGSYTNTYHRTGPGIFSAVGVHLRVRGVRGFIETAAHVATVSGEFAGSLPLTFGLTL